MRARALAAYGALCYAASIASLVVLFGWLGGPIPFPLRVDEGGGPASAGAFAWNTAIMIGFGLYHSLFARSAVKTWTRRVVGRNLERATYNLVSAVLAILLALGWRPIAPVVWSLEPPAASAMVALEVFLWIAHVTSIVLMNWNEFWGLRQIGFAMRGEPYRPLPPVSEAYYVATRLTLVISLLLIPWASPVMTVGHVQLAVFMTVYIALGAWLSNRDRGDVTVSAILPQST